MTRNRLNQLAWLEGRQVDIALRDGSRIDDSKLVSAGLNTALSVWLVENGDDTFVDVEDIVDMWESQSISG